MYKRDDCRPRLMALGISEEDANALRRIAMTLHRWYEMECGDDFGHVERENEDGSGKPLWVSARTGRRMAIPDREAGANKRLAKIMARYPELTAYHQTDPRGASLYILRPGDVPDGANVDAYYSRGVSVYR